MGCLISPENWDRKSMAAVALLFVHMEGVGHVLVQLIRLWMERSYAVSKKIGCSRLSVIIFVIR